LSGRKPSLWPFTIRGQPPCALTALTPCRVASIDSRGPVLFISVGLIGSLTASGRALGMSCQEHCDYTKSPGVSYTSNVDGNVAFTKTDRSICFIFNPIHGSHGSHAIRLQVTPQLNISATKRHTGCAIRGSCAHWRPQVSTSSPACPRDRILTICILRIGTIPSLGCYIRTTRWTWTVAFHASSTMHWV
jgi:hypothetical protein